MKESLCNICESDDFKPYLKSNEYLINQCKTCTHIQVVPIPNEKVLAELYKNVAEDSFYANSCSVGLFEEHGMDKEFMRIFFSERLEIINTYTPGHDSNILDFSCTNGLFVKQLNETGFKNVYGYDIAEDMVEEGKKMGLNLISGDLEEMVAGYASFFNLVYANNVMEHLPYPVQTTHSLMKLIKKGGYVVISVPYILSLFGRLLKSKSPIVDPPYHIHYYTRKSIRKLLEDQGFDIVSISTTFWTKLTDTYLIEKGLNKNIAILLRVLASPLNGIINKLYLGGNLLVVAQKK